MTAAFESCRARFARRRKGGFEARDDLLTSDRMHSADLTEAGNVFRGSSVALRVVKGDLDPCLRTDMERSDEWAEDAQSWLRAPVATKSSPTT
jgi:hypothetical protein